jgi:peptidoglycan/xylan/chitin deacetylase (PgdA/CDA1 family)
MMARSQLGQLYRSIVCSVHRRPVSLKLQTPLVSFCFDDFPRTAYTAGGRILQSFGARGTYYAALGLMNTSNELGDQLTQADIDSLLSDGHELGSHTFSHCSSRCVPLREFEKDALRGRDAIQQITGLGAGSFSYPFGHVALASKKRIGEQMNSCRSIIGGINGSVIDLNLLRANSLYGDVDQFEKIESLLLKNERECGWLIFYTHDVRTNPSAFGCTPALLERVVEGTQEMGFSVAPVADVVTIVSRPASETSLGTALSSVEK